MWIPGNEIVADKWMYTVDLLIFATVTFLKHISAVMSLARTEGDGQAPVRKQFPAFNSSRHKTCHSHLLSAKIIWLAISSRISHTLHTLTRWHADPTELRTSAPHKTALEHFEMNTNIAYATNTAEIPTTENVAYMTAGDAIPTTQNVAYGQVPPGTDECYDYVIL